MWTSSQARHTIRAAGWSNQSVICESCASIWKRVFERTRRRVWRSAATHRKNREFLGLCQDQAQAILRYSSKSDSPVPEGDGITFQTSTPDQENREKGETCSRRGFASLAPKGNVARKKARRCARPARQGDQCSQVPHQIRIRPLRQEQTEKSITKVTMAESRGRAYRRQMDSCGVYRRFVGDTRASAKSAQKEDGLCNLG